MNEKRGDGEEGKRRTPKTENPAQLFLFSA
jgi:hypothetical protein